MNGPIVKPCCGFNGNYPGSPLLPPTPPGRKLTGGATVFSPGPPRAPAQWRGKELIPGTVHTVRDDASGDEIDGEAPARAALSTLDLSSHAINELADPPAPAQYLGFAAADLVTAVRRAVAFVADDSALDTAAIRLHRHQVVAPYFLPPSSAP